MVQFINEALNTLYNLCMKNIDIEVYTHSSSEFKSLLEQVDQTS